MAAIGIENGYVVGQDLELIDEYAARGARYLTLVHNGDNDLGRSAQPKPELGDPPTDDVSGLTPLGAQAVARLNRAGIMVDVSHGSKQHGARRDAAIDGAGDSVALRRKRLGPIMRATWMTRLCLRSAMTAA